MTEKNYNYRTSQTLLRNQFPGKGKWKIPVIPKFQPKDGDFNDLLLIGFDKTNLEDQNHLDRACTRSPAAVILSSIYLSGTRPLHRRTYEFFPDPSEADRRGRCAPASATC